MLIATSPRLSSDQEKKKSTEEAYPVEVDCMSAKCNSGIFYGKRGNTQTHEEHYGNIPTSQATNEYTTDWITTKHLKELSDNQRTINAQSPVCCNSIKPTIMQSDIQHYTSPTVPQGEEFIYYVQHAEASSKELDSSLQTAVHTNEFCNFLQTATVESEESTFSTLTVQSEKLHSSIQMATVQLQLGNPLQTSTAQSEDLTNHLQISTVKSEKFCNSLKTATLQSEEPFKSSHTATVQSEELCSAIQMPAVLSEKLLDCLQTETVHSEGPYNSLWAVTDQPEELNRPLQTSTVQLEKLGDLSNTSSLQSLEFYNSKEVETIQPGDPYNLKQSALDDYHAGQAVPNHSEVLYQSMQATIVQAECHHTMKATEDQVDSSVNPGQRSSTQFAEPHYVKQASTVQSEEIYLSRICDSVTANKVAVEGDLNG